MINEEISNYIFLNDVDLKGDIAFVFGTDNARKNAVEKVVELYVKGLVPKIIFSGGVNVYSGVIEAEEMAKEAIKLGVPKKDILIENKSANTLENVLFSLKVIDTKL